MVAPNFSIENHSIIRMRMVRCIATHLYIPPAWPVPDTDPACYVRSDLAINEPEKLDERIVLMSLAIIWLIGVLRPIEILNSPS
jgi:hypothetical protein